MMGRRERVAVLALGIAAGTWIGRRAAGQPLDLLEVALGVALLVAAVLVLILPVSRRPLTRHELEVEVARYAAEKRRQAGQGGGRR
jgi:hypothetical protein